MSLGVAGAAELYLGDGCKGGAKGGMTPAGPITIPPPPPPPAPGRSGRRVEIGVEVTS